MAEPSQAGAPLPDRVAGPVPVAAGIGLRHEHFRDFVEGRPSVAWVECHSENFIDVGDGALEVLTRVRRDYPLSCHGVGLSLGSAERLDEGHLRNLRRLIDRFEPALVSEHVSWSITGGTYLNDLLPLPYTEEALSVFCRNVDEAQQALGRQILVENPASYMAFAHSTMEEWEFIASVAQRTGCAILLDVNNVYVSAMNHDADPWEYLRSVPGDAVQEIHVAGHLRERWDDGTAMLIDDHGGAVDDAVWHLLRLTLERMGPRPVLVEWDTRLPPLPLLLDEAKKADSLVDACRRNSGASSGRRAV